MLACREAKRLVPVRRPEVSVDIVHPDIDRYLKDLACPVDPILREMEVLAAERSFPIVGPQVGRLLYVIALSISARRVIELGSGFGYSAYWFAKAVGPRGLVVLSEASPERADEAAQFLRRAGFADRIRIEVGDALTIADRIGGEFDIVFNDVDKELYPEVFSRASSLLRPGGLLICDNMLWFGTVLEERPAQASTLGVQRLTRLLFDSAEFETALIPIRDGVSVSVRR
jgi:predicted O-methyltransferase YrrM